MQYSNLKVKSLHNFKTLHETSACVGNVTRKLRTRTKSAEAKGHEANAGLQISLASRLGLVTSLEMETCWFFKHRLHKETKYTWARTNWQYRHSGRIPPSTRSDKEERLITQREPFYTTEGMHASSKAPDPQHSRPTGVQWATSIRSRVSRMPLHSRSP